MTGGNTNHYTTADPVGIETKGNASADNQERMARTSFHHGNTANRACDLLLGERGGASPQPSSMEISRDVHGDGAVIAQLAARRSHNPKVVSSILTHRIFFAHTACRPREMFQTPFGVRHFSWGHTSCSNVDGRNGRKHTLRTHIGLGRGEGL